MEVYGFCLVDKRCKKQVPYWWRLKGCAWIEFVEQCDMMDGQDDSAILQEGHGGKGSFEEIWKVV